MREHLLYIGGSWRPGSGSPAAATSPSSGQAFATVAMADAADVDAAVTAALAAWPGWAAMSAFDRAAACDRVVAVIAGHRDELARALTEDQGKPLVAEAYVAAGNTVVWVPAPSTTACCAVLSQVIAAAGLPPGVFNFAPGLGPVAGDALAGHPAVAGLGFVGSVRTGALVAARAAGKTQLLELGGNGPMVILEDADLELATEAALEAAYLCAGQSCTAGERFLVHAKVRAEFTERVVEATRARVRLGDPFDAATTMGPLNNEQTADKFDRHVADAVAHGARICCGGLRAVGFPTSLFAEPTVLNGVQPGMAIEREETFGPVVPIVAVRSADEALKLTNASPFGLTAAVFTGDLERGLAFAELARAGWVNINASTNLWESHLPFGGRAGSVSGRGRVGGRYPIQTFTEPKTVVYPAPRYVGPAVFSPGDSSTRNSSTEGER